MGEITRPINVRPASFDDAGAIAAVHVLAWQAAYKGIVPANHLEALSIEARAAAWRGSIARAACEVWVADEHWSIGIGRALWEVAHARLLEKGYSAVTLRVLAENARAIQFYTAAGFAATTTGHTVEIGGKALEEVRYGRRLA